MMCICSNSTTVRTIKWKWINTFPFYFTFQFKLEETAKLSLKPENMRILYAWVPVSINSSHDNKINTPLLIITRCLTPSL